MSSLGEAVRRFSVPVMLALMWSGMSTGQPLSKTPHDPILSEIHKDGRVVLHLPAREVKAPPPAIAGDFTNWTPVRMKRHGEEWRFSARLSGGVYRFAFRSADGEWFVPTGFPNRTDDQMGGWVAVLVVP